MRREDDPRAVEGGASTAPDADATPPRDTFCLGFHGTSTNQRRGPTDPNSADNLTKYPAGNTISILFDYIPGAMTAQSQPVLGEELAAEFSACILDGPNAPGTNVHPIIAEGVVTLLNQIANGKKNISIVGHSRGAVISHLVLYILGKINTDYKPHLNDESLLDFLLRIGPLDENLNGQKSLQQCFKQLATRIGKLDLADVKQNLRQTQFFATELDPVPGEKLMALPGWHSHGEIFYTAPNLHLQRLVFYSSHERSSLFRPLYRKPGAQGDYHCEIFFLPGHHGTLGGKLGTQMGFDIPESGGELETEYLLKLSTQHVQLLVMRKTIAGFKANGVTFDSEKVVEDLIAISLESDDGESPEEARGILKAQVLKTCADSFEYDPLVGVPLLCQEIVKNMEHYVALSDQTYRVKKLPAAYVEKAGVRIFKVAKGVQLPMGDLLQQLLSTPTTPPQSREVAALHHMLTTSLAAEPHLPGPARAQMLSPSLQLGLFARLTREASGAAEPDAEQEERATLAPPGS